jgi:hypothetical protein
VAEVKRYLDGYTARGMSDEGMALARLRKAIEPQANTALQIPTPNQNEKEEQT